MPESLRPGFEGLSLSLSAIPSFETMPILWVIAAFVCAAAAIAIAGVYMTGVADRIADQTGLGEALVGGVLLGATTSLSGVIVSVVSAYDGRASLAFSNGVGGIAAQTAFLAVADMVHRRTNLEHAASEPANIFQGGLLIILLTFPLIAYLTPEVSFWAIHPASVLLIAVYVLGVRVAQKVKEEPMWRPVMTPGTKQDVPEEEQRSGRGLAPILLRFAGLVAVVGVAGWVISQSGARIVDTFGLSASTVGALFTAVSTSLPELVTTLTAVRRGAVQLAVGGIIGGNVFDVNFVALADFAYRDGSLYHAVDPFDLFWLAVGVLMTMVLVLGLIVRERRGPAGIGTESAALLAIYGGAVAIQAFAG